jgi:capsular polysaccharide biosynthesis protein
MDRPIADKALSALLADAGGSTDRVSVAAEIAPAGSYQRHAPLILDLAAVAAELQEQLRSYFNNTSHNYPARYLARLDAAIVTGQGAVVTAGEHLIHESVAEFVNHGLVPDGFVMKDGGLSFAKPVTRRVEGPALLLKRPWYKNFGHWLVDNATILALLPSLPLPPGYRIIQGDVQQPAMRAIVASIFERLVPGIPLILHGDDETLLCEQLLYVTPLHVPPLFKLPLGLEMLRQRFQPTAPAPPTGSRLFITRRGSTFRNVENEAQLAGLCQRYGFDVIMPETMSFAEQVARFAGAEAVIGVKGAALTNIIFCPSCCAVVVLSPADFVDPFYWDIAGQRQMAYAEIFGAVTTERATGLNDFVIPMGKVRDALETMLPRP